MKKTFLLLLFTGGFAFADKLEDVSILDFKSGPSNFELKLRARDMDQNSYFYLNIMKSDPGAFEKMVRIMEKLILKDGYTLNLDIASFSDSPRGSYYTSQDISFDGTTKNGFKSDSQLKSKVKKK